MRKKILERVYAAGDRLNKLRKKPLKIPGAKVVSIGNITTGGTGKTPATIYFAKLLHNEDFNTGILSRGYGGELSKTGAILSDGRNILLDELESGDEPWMMAANLPEIPIAIGRSRYEMGLALRQKFGIDLFILDDGMQHYRLARDVEIVLIDSTNPFGNGRLLPHGILREPVHELRRADIVILTKTDLCPQNELESIEQQVRDYSKKEVVFRSIHKPRGFVKIPSPYPAWQYGKKPKMVGTDLIRSETVWAISAIGNHRSFEQTLRNLGASQVNSISFRDHHHYAEKDIENILSRVSPYDYIITTEKDWVKLQKFSQRLERLKNFYFLQIEFHIRENEILLKEGLKAKLLIRD